MGSRFTRILEVNKIEYNWKFGRYNQMQLFNKQYY